MNAEEEETTKRYAINLLQHTTREICLFGWQFFLQTNCRQHVVLEQLVHLCSATVQWPIALQN